MTAGTTAGRAPQRDAHAAGPAMDGDLSLALRRQGEELQVRVAGPNTRGNTFGYWRAIAEAIEARPAGLLLLVDELVGPALPAQDWRELVAEIGPRLGRLRVAHVKPRGVDTVEHCMLSALDSGLEAQVFADVRAASLWLRYGDCDAEPRPADA